MPRKIDFDIVRKAASALPDVEEITSKGIPSLKVRGKLLAWPPTNKSAEPGSLAVRIDPESRSELLEADPATYYITDHYTDYPVVLFRLARLRPEALKDLLLMGWKFVAARNPSRRK